MTPVHGRCDGRFGLVSGTRLCYGPAMEIPERIKRRIRKADSGCWEWTGAVGSHGYGQARIDKRDHRIHRLMYEASKGPIPDGLVIDHLCRNKICCNPDHLEAATPKVNSQRHWGREGFCKRGHPKTPGNLYTSPGGHTKCLVCKAIREPRRPRVLISVCKNGHEMTPENTRVVPGNGRVCRACKREWYHIKKARLNAR